MIDEALPGIQELMGECVQTPRILSNESFCKTMLGTKMENNMASVFPTEFEVSFFRMWFDHFLWVTGTAFSQVSISASV